MKLIKTGVLSLLLLLAPIVSYAQNTCMPRDQLANILLSEYGEEVVFAGEARNNEYTVELFVNEETGSWTVIATGRNQPNSCIVDGGFESHFTTDQEKLDSRSTDS